MSFQGDVAGLGLGELLQGLGRGGRDGVLFLFSKSLTVSIGVHSGQIYLLSSPDEDDAEWQQRCAMAWAGDPDPQRESARRAEIARADRLEKLYGMIRVDNLHFRFEQGALPTAPGAAQSHVDSISIGSGQTGGQSNEIIGWGRGITAEYLLLEHARISDESADELAQGITAHDVPRTLDPKQHTPQELDFLQHLDGNSTLQEISDRLGRPFTAILAKLVPYLREGQIRIADPRELLASCQRELEQGNTNRAAARLTGWIRNAPAGPPSMGDVDLLVGEWERGRLGHLLAVVPVREARTLLHKLDHVHTDKRASRQRWSTLQSLHPTNDLVLLNEVTMRLVDLAEPDASTFRDLLRLARSFQEQGFAARTRTLLTLAAQHLPGRPLVRIELGRRMLDVGLESDGVAWLLETANEQLAADLPERALLAVRAVLRHDSENEEAKEVTQRAHKHIKNRRRRKAGTTVAIAVGAIAAVAALVRFQVQRSLDDKLEQVTALSESPVLALVKFDEFFVEQNSDAKLSALRKRLVRKIDDLHSAEHHAWRRNYDAVASFASEAPYSESLARVLEVPVPPNRLKNQPFSARQDLLGILSARLSEEAAATDVDLNASEDDLNQEGKLLDDVVHLVNTVENMDLGPEADSFRFGLADLQEQIAERRRTRETEHEIERLRQKEKNLDILLASARVHAAAGELEAAIRDFEHLFESDSELRSLAPVQREFRALNLRLETITRATDLARDGDHETAIRLLETLGEEAQDLELPWRVSSQPSGARVRLRDGTYKTTPFHLLSAVDKEIQLRFELPGYQVRELVVSQPGDQQVFLYRHAEFQFADEHRIEAVPLRVDDDYMIVDRQGGVRRLTPNGEIVWERTLETLAGFSLPPIPLPRRSGHVLLVSAEGRAWVMDVENGSTDGPTELPSGPAGQPVQSRSGVSFYLRGGSIAYFQRDSEPTLYKQDSAPASTLKKRDVEQHFEVLVSSATSAMELESLWGDWSASIHEDRVRLTGGHTADDLQRFGDWHYIAWEAPSDSATEGRFWISDDSGVRAFLPTPARK